VGVFAAAVEAVGLHPEEEEVGEEEFMHSIV
jgi:hypothetical protein